MSVVAFERKRTAGFWDEAELDTIVAALSVALAPGRGREWETGMDALVDLMLAEARVPAAHEGEWLERLRQAAHSFRAMALKHPKFFPFFAVHRLNTPSGVAFINGIIGILREAGFSDRDAARYFREIGYYLTGAALDETAGYAQGPSAAEPVSNATIAANFPHLAAAAPYFQPGQFQATFETGLEILLDGVRRAREAFP